MGLLSVYTLKNRFLCSFDLPIKIASISTQRVESARYIKTVLILAETIPALVHGLVFAPTNRNSPKALLIPVKLLPGHEPYIVLAANVYRLYRRPARIAGVKIAI